MKKAKILVAAAFLLAIASAFAPKASQISGTHYRDAGGGSCPQDITCSGGSTTCGYTVAGCTSPIGQN
jgi:hypothetical protein